MARFRKKPVVIEAVKAENPEYIETLEGRMLADIGDYIITGVKGERYPCKPDIFELSYEPADAPRSSTPSNKEIVGLLREWAEWLSGKHTIPWIILQMRAFADRLEAEGTTTAPICAKCGRPYTPEPSDYGLCCICFRDVAYERVYGENWREKILHELSAKNLSSTPTLAELVTPEEAGMLLFLVCGSELIETDCVNIEPCGGYSIGKDAEWVEPPASAKLCAKLYRLAMLAQKKEEVIPASERTSEEQLRIDARVERGDYEEMREADQEAKSDL